MGGTIVALGVVLEMGRTGISLKGGEPTALITTGPFRLSRNPLYLSNVFLYAGVAVLVNSLSILVLLPVAVALTELLVIRREEEYLHGRFEQPYVEYKRHVRRWL